MKEKETMSNDLFELNDNELLILKGGHKSPGVPDSTGNNCYCECPLNADNPGAGNNCNCSCA